MQLGQDIGFGLKAEVSDSQIYHCVRLALEEYSRHFPLRSYQSFIAYPGQAFYVPDPPVRGVTEVEMIESQDAVLLSPETALLSGSFLGFSGGFFGLSTPYEYAIFKEWKEEAEQTLSLRPHYQFVPEDGNLYLYVPLTSYNISFTGMVNLDVGFDEEVEWPDEVTPENRIPSPARILRLDKTLKGVRQQHLHWVRRLALAQTMQVLGRVRRKYSAIPGMEGQSISLDGQALVSDGERLWDKALTDMLKARVGFAPMMG